MPLEVVAYGSPILRRQTDAIENINEKIIELINDMSVTMNAYQGVGLAAPQIGVSKSLFLINWDHIDEEKSGYQAYINPKILEFGDEMVEADEGCLSLPEVWAPVRRSNRIRVEFTTIDGKISEETLTGMPSRVFQHENDHLLGILFIDRISNSERKKVKNVLQDIMDGEIPVSPEEMDVVPAESDAQAV